MAGLSKDAGLERVVLSGGPLRIDEVVGVARGRAAVELSDAGRKRMTASREVVERLVTEGKRAYGVSTGFGLLANTPIAPSDLRELQRRIVLSHATGSGDPLETEVVRAMSIEGLLGTDRPFQRRLHELRPHPGQLASADNLRELLAGSPILASHRHSDHAIQDAYSLRCAPQVHGACRDVVAFARQVIERELGSVTDNP